MPITHLFTAFNRRSQGMFTPKIARASPTRAALF